MIKHATASVFVFHHDADAGWRAGLVWHPLFNVWIMPGGHVEDDENQAEAALREAAEETGLSDVRLLPSAAPLKLDGATIVPTPRWIVEHVIPGDNHLRERHVHIDHKYVGVSDTGVSTTEPAHPFRWCTAVELADLPMFDDVRAALTTLFDIVPQHHTMVDG